MLVIDSLQELCFKKLQERLTSIHIEGSKCVGGSAPHRVALAFGAALIVQSG